MRYATDEELRLWLTHNCGEWHDHDKSFNIPQATLARLVGFWIDHATVCPRCAGKGRNAERLCSTCGGLGRKDL